MQALVFQNLDKLIFASLDQNIRTRNHIAHPINIFNQQKSRKIFKRNQPTTTITKNIFFSCTIKKSEWYLNFTCLYSPWTRGRTRILVPQETRNVVRWAAITHSFENDHHNHGTKKRMKQREEILDLFCIGMKNNEFSILNLEDLSHFLTIFIFCLGSNTNSNLHIHRGDTNIREKEKGKRDTLATFPPTADTSFKCTKWCTKWCKKERERERSRLHHDTKFRWNLEK